MDGTRGTLRLGANYRMTVTSQGGTRHEDVSPPPLAWAQRPRHNIQESVRNIQAHWAECLRSGAAPETSGDDNLKTLELVYAAYESAAAGQRTVEFDGP